MIATERPKAVGDKILPFVKENDDVLLCRR